ncbi:hypothetical protein SKAU_G00303070 [Synaphobranchus kaupii]|uniref:Uncharacterized protein n=1 Tax=Synaphobranchus kaupii TaxID=118154 RepID=A0A9Q1EW39_SYNKA|nr:hypothetical protein SKAU_G00303070 [Synaphobranchus kaupii]
MQRVHLEGSGRRTGEVPRGQGNSGFWLTGLPRSQISRGQVDNFAGLKQRWHGPKHNRSTPCRAPEHAGGLYAGCLIRDWAVDLATASGGTAELWQMCVRLRRGTAFPSSPSAKTAGCDLNGRDGTRRGGAGRGPPSLHGRLLNASRPGALRVSGSGFSRKTAPGSECRTGTGSDIRRYRIPGQTERDGDVENLHMRAAVGLLSQRSAGKQIGVFL